MAIHSGVLAWRIPGTGHPGGLPSVGTQRVGHDWSDSAAAASIWCRYSVVTNNHEIIITSVLLDWLWVKSDGYVLKVMMRKMGYFSKTVGLFFQDCWLWKKRNSVLAKEDLVLRELCGLAVVVTIYYEQTMVCLKL